MSISPVQSSIAATLSPLLAGQEKGRPATPDTADPALRSPGPAATAPANDDNANSAAATISLSPAATSADLSASQATRPVLSPVYAEIWRGGVRVAQVDIHGQVTSSEGVVAAAGSGLAGPLLAAQRAIQAARQLGGEIRSAGQAVDGQTLLMRERLARTYTV